MQGIQDSITETQSSGSKKRTIQESVDSVEAHNKKYQRFELDTEDSYKRRDLPPGLVTYVNKYLVNHISKKDLKEKILQEKPVPLNIKKIQILDKYIKELLVENKKSYILNHEVLSIKIPLHWTI